MSQPKRYGFPMCECDATDEFRMEDFGMAELNDGGFVKYDDYAALAADYVELKDLYLKCRIDIGNLKKENERLRAAGDAVIIAYQRLIVEHPDLLRAINVAIGDWNAAKKGRDAK